MLAHLSEIEAWRNTLDGKRRAKLNHPHRIIAMWRRSLPPPTQTAPAAPTVRLTVWPQDFRHRAAHGIERALKVFGNDPCQLARAALDAALPRRADVENLLAAQILPRGQPKPTTRPRTPAMVVLDTSPPRATRAHVHA
jgi:FAD/FMN-containing dehydrogenase